MNQSVDLRSMSDVIMRTMHKAVAKQSNPKYFAHKPNRDLGMKFPTIGYEAPEFKNLGYRALNRAAIQKGIDRTRDKETVREFNLQEDKKSQKEEMRWLIKQRYHELIQKRMEKLKKHLTPQQQKEEIDDLLGVFSQSNIEPSIVREAVEEVSGLDAIPQHTLTADRGVASLGREVPTAVGDEDERAVTEERTADALRDAVDERGTIRRYTDIARAVEQLGRQPDSIAELNNILRSLGMQNTIWSQYERYRATFTGSA